MVTILRYVNIFTHTYVHIYTRITQIYMYILKVIHIYCNTCIGKDQTTIYHVSKVVNSYILLFYYSLYRSI